MKSIKTYPTLAEVAAAMDMSGGMRFNSEAEINAALASVAYMMEDAMAAAEAEAALFVAADQDGINRLATEPMEDTGISADLNAVLEDIYGGGWLS